MSDCKIMRKCLIVGFVVFVGFAGFYMPVFGQCPGTGLQKALAELPSEFRASFSSSFERALGHQVEAKWSEFYDMSIHSVVQDVDKETFVAAQLRKAKWESRRLTGFSPSSAVLANMYNESKVWLIEGCGIYKRNSKKLCRRSAVSAMLHHGKWYFDDITVMVDAVGGSEGRCKS